MRIWPVAARRWCPCPTERNQSSVHACTRPYIMSIYKCLANGDIIFGLLDRKCDLIRCVCLSACLSATQLSLYVLNTFRKNHFGIYSDLINVVHRSSSLSPMLPPPSSSMSPPIICIGVVRIRMFVVRLLPIKKFKYTRATHTHTLESASHISITHTTVRALRRCG